MASKQVRGETDVEELLDTVDKTMDRLKTLYEQYFLGIQKQAPSFIHNDIERKLRDLAQMQLRNTGLRYRLATLQQKFGSYNSYWRRTLRQIENGTYARQLSKVGRDAARSGADIPNEILAKMPKRMRDQVLRDREQALAIARRHNQVQVAAAEAAEPPEADSDFIAMIKEPTEVRRKLKSTDGAHLLTNDDDFDIDAFFADVEQKDDDKPAAARTATPPRGRGQTRQPANRGRTTSMPPSYDDPDRPRPITRNDLKRAATEPATPTARASSPVIPRPGPPPVPTRATGAIPSIKRPDTNLDNEEPTNPNVPVSRAAVPTPITAQPSARAKTVTGSSMASQNSRPNPIAPGAAAARGPVQVEQLQGPFPRKATPVQGVPAIPRSNVTGVVPVIPQTGAVPRIPGSSATPSAGIPAIPRPPGTDGQPPIPRPPGMGGQPAIARSGTGPSATIPSDMTGPHQAIPRPAPAAARTTPAAGVPAIPGDEVIVTRTPASARTPAAGVPIKPGTGARPPLAAPQKPPPGMTDADVNALYAKYVRAKEMVGEKIGPGEHNKLLKTINAQAPKIMEQYKAKGVDFSIVVKDNQVIIRAKPKT
ncbi:MAG: MXAN_5187 C-terminal domain-containing protein [Deltaproteobacteria bacterium]